jgi:hypothetical protein
MNRRTKGLGLWIYTIIPLVFLLIPISHTFVFSFNDSGKLNIAWQGFTLDKWLTVCNTQGLCEAFGNSILVGVVATVLATVLTFLIGPRPPQRPQRVSGDAALADRLAAALPTGVDAATVALIEDNGERTGHVGTSLTARHDCRRLGTGGEHLVDRGLLEPVEQVADGLVDGLHLFTFPLTRGTGPRLFADGDPPRMLERIAAESYDNGVTYLAFRPVGDMGAGPG